MPKKAWGNLFALENAFWTNNLSSKALSQRALRKKGKEVYQCLTTLIREGNGIKNKLIASKSIIIKKGK